jgi:hypothetical protein
LVPSPDGRWVSFSGGAGKVDILDTRTGQAKQFGLAKDARPLDMQWLILDSTSAARLAVITGQSQIILLDPDNRQQFSGQAASQPLAILSIGTNQPQGRGLVVLANGSLEPLQVANQSASLHPTAFGDKTALVQQLNFQPARGAWKSIGNAQAQQTMGTGWLAAGEPALFMLNEQMQPLWHYRLPVGPTDQPLTNQIATAVSPGNGRSVWAVLGHSGRVHLLRDDASWSDQLRTNRGLCGLALIPVGDRLALALADATRLTLQRLE